MQVRSDGRSLSWMLAEKYLFILNITAQLVILCCVFTFPLVQIKLKYSANPMITATITCIQVVDTTLLFQCSVFGLIGSCFVNLQGLVCLLYTSVYTIMWHVKLALLIANQQLITQRGNLLHFIFGICVIFLRQSKNSVFAQVCIPSDGTNLFPSSH